MFTNCLNGRGVRGDRVNFPILKASLSNIGSKMTPSVVATISVLLLKVGLINDCMIRNTTKIYKLLLKNKR